MILKIEKYVKNHFYQTFFLINALIFIFFSLLLTFNTSIFFSLFSTFILFPILLVLCICIFGIFSHSPKTLLLIFTLPVVLLLSLKFSQDIQQYLKYKHLQQYGSQNEKIRTEVLFAIERYRTDHQKSPRSIEELMPEYLSSIPQTADSKKFTYELISSDKFLLKYSSFPSETCYAYDPQRLYSEEWVDCQYSNYYSIF